MTDDDDDSNISHEDASCA